MRKLVFFILLFEIGYFCLWLIQRYRYSINDIGVPSDNGMVMLFLFLWAVYLMSVYIGLYIWRQKINWQKHFNLLIWGTVIFVGTLIFILPLTSSDIFTYIMQGRLLGVHHLNPYINSVSSQTADNFYNLVCFRWRETPMVYGPTWGIISAGISKLAGSSLALNLLIFRLIVAAAYGCSVYLLYKILDKLNSSQKYFATFFYAWNPLLLFESINNGHNDIIMVALVLLAIYLYLQKKYLAVLPVLFLACLIKYIFILLLPFVLILLLGKFENMTGSDKSRLVTTFILKNILICSFILIFNLLFFNWGSGMIEAVLFQGKLFWYGNLAILPAVLVQIFHLSKEVVKPICLVVFSAVYFYFLYKFLIIKNKKLLDLNKYIIYVIALYLITASFLLNEWYILWLLPFMIINFKPKYLITVLLLTLAGLLTSSLVSVTLFFLLSLAVYLVLLYIRRTYELVRKIRK